MLKSDYSMNIIKCPKCKSEEFIVFKKEGSLYDGKVIEIVECLNCNNVYDIVAEISTIKIEESQYN